LVCLVSTFLIGHPWIMSDGVAPDKPLDHSVITRLQQFSAMNKLKKMALRVSTPTIFILQKGWRTLILRFLHFPLILLEFPNVGYS